MGENLTVMKIVKKHLEDNNIQGLCNDDCGCDVKDLAPCGEMRDDCSLARKIGDSYMSLGYGTDE